MLFYTHSHCYAHQFSVGVFLFISSRAFGDALGWINEQFPRFFFIYKSPLRGIEGTKTSRYVIFFICKKNLKFNWLDVYLKHFTRVGTRHE